MALTSVNPALLDSQAQYTAFKNRIINGAMQIDQRNAGASITPINGQFSVDRFVLNLSQASKFTIQQNAGSVTPPVGFSNYMGATSSSAYAVATGDYFLVSQLIEGFNVADLAWGTANAKAVTLSFQVYSSLTGTFGGSINNSANNRSYPFSYTVSASNTWTSVSVTIPGDTSGTWYTNSNTGLILRFSIGTGTTYSGSAGSSRSNTANAWTGTQYSFAPTGATSVVGTNGATFYITGVQLEKGSTATSFDYRPYGTELQLCQRYYKKFNLFGAGCWGGSGGSVPICSYSWSQTMRAAPTLSWISGGSCGNGNVGLPITGINFLSSASPDGYIFGYSVTGSTGSNAQGMTVDNPVMSIASEL